MRLADADCRTIARAAEIAAWRRNQPQTATLTKVNAFPLEVGQLALDMTNDTSESIPRRKASAETMAGREAAALVRELNRRIGRWQAASVKLYTMAQRLKATGRADPSVREEAHTLFQVVATEAQRFEELLPEQPSAVARHGRINDTRQSFDMITDRLRASLQLLGANPEAE